MDVITIKDSKTLEEKTGEVLAAMLQSAGTTPLLLLISGGSSLGLLKHIPEKVLAEDAKNLTVGMLDDRYSEDPAVNSFSLLKNDSIGSGFYTRVVKAGGTFLDSAPQKNETLEQYAERYEKYIRTWIGKNPNGLIRATIGIGPDGHTSGILPFPEAPEKFHGLFDTTDKLVIGYDVGDKNQYRYRMTSTFPLMRMCNQSITYMTGENKKAALKKVLAQEGTLAETPGRIVRELKNAVLFTDIEV